MKFFLLVYFLRVVCFALLFTPLASQGACPSFFSLLSCFFSLLCCTFGLAVSRSDSLFFQPALLCSHFFPIVGRKSLSLFFEANLNLSLGLKTNYSKSLSLFFGLLYSDSSFFRLLVSGFRV